MTHADINDLETRDYIFKIGDREKAIQARYDENTDALIFPRAAFDYVYKLLEEALSQEPCDDAISRKEALNCINDTWGDYFILNELFERIDKLPSVTQKSIECEDAISQIKERIAYYENRKPKDGYDGVSYGKTEDGGGELKNPRTVEYERYSNRQIGLEEALEIIQNRSVTPKSGKWIRSLIYENTFNCSKCGSAGYDTFKYCPNCGCRMESEE